MWNCKNCGTAIDDSIDQCSFCGYNKLSGSIIKSSSSNPSSGNNVESKLEKVASVILVIGILASIVFFILGCVYCFKYSEIDKYIGIAMFASIIPVLISSIATWALFKVIANISSKLNK